MNYWEINGIDGDTMNKTHRKTPNLCFISLWCYCCFYILLFLFSIFYFISSIYFLCLFSMDNQERAVQIQWAVDFRFKPNLFESKK